MVAALSLPLQARARQREPQRQNMARMLLLSCLVACCAALQPSQMLSTRAQVAQRTAAPVMKRADYFLRVSRSEAGRPRLCVFRWAFDATT